MMKLYKPLLLPMEVRIGIIMNRENVYIGLWTVILQKENERLVFWEKK